MTVCISLLKLQRFVDTFNLKKTSMTYISIDKCHLLQDRTSSVHDKLSVFVTPFPPKINISYQAWVVEIVSKMIRKLTFNQLTLLEFHFDNGNSAGMLGTTNCLYINEVQRGTYLLLKQLQ